jgi:hypothetical protein
MTFIPGEVTPEDVVTVPPDEPTLEEPEPIEE